MHRHGAGDCNAEVFDGGGEVLDRAGSKPAYLKRAALGDLDDSVAAPFRRLGNAAQHRRGQSRIVGQEAGKETVAGRHRRAQRRARAAAKRCAHIDRTWNTLRHQATLATEKAAASEGGNRAITPCPCVRTGTPRPMLRRAVQLRRPVSWLATSALCRLPGPYGPGGLWQGPVAPSCEGGRGFAPRSRFTRKGTVACR